MIRRIEDRFGVIDCNEPINHSYCDVDKRYYSVDYSVASLTRIESKKILLLYNK